MQYSIFECRLEPDALERLRSLIARLTDPEKDRVRIYRLCQKCVGKVEIFGPGTSLEDLDVYVL